MHPAVGLGKARTMAMDMALIGLGGAVDMMLPGTPLALDMLLIIMGMASGHTFRPSLKCGWAEWTVMTG